MLNMLDSIFIFQACSKFKVLITIWESARSSTILNDDWTFSLSGWRVGWHAPVSQTVYIQYVMADFSCVRGPGGGRSPPLKEKKGKIKWGKRKKSYSWLRHTLHNVMLSVEWHPHKLRLNPWTKPADTMLWMVSVVCYLIRRYNVPSRKYHPRELPFFPWNMRLC